MIHHEATDLRSVRPSDGIGFRNAGIWKSVLVVSGGLLSAVAASSCCVLPLVLFVLGIGGAWIGNLTALAPYQPFFIAAASGFLAMGYYLVYRKPRVACDSGCERTLPHRALKLSLWAGTLLLAAAIAFPYLARTVLGE